MQQMGQQAVSSSIKNHIPEAAKQGNLFVESKQNGVHEDGKLLWS